MPRKLTIAVTCTDRKTSTPMTELRVRSLAPGPVHERATAWSERLLHTADRRPLRNLYAGETWNQVLLLEAGARRGGFDPNLVVLSAGLGMLSAESQAPAYSATFTRGVSDSVGTSVHEVQDWWASINAAQARTTELPPHPAVVVMSEAYAKAIPTDHFADRDDVILFGGSDSVPETVRVRSDLALRSVLGGTASSLNVRMARSWLESTNAREPNLRESLRQWRLWAAQRRAPETYERRQLTDEQIRQFVVSVRRRDPAVSKSRALRMLRDSDMACEQKRFGQLFAEAAAS